MTTAKVAQCLMRSPGGTAAGRALRPSGGSRTLTARPASPPCFEEQAVSLTGPLGVVLAGFHEVLVDGHGLLWQRFRFVAGDRQFEPQSPRLWLRYPLVAPAVTSTGSVHAAHQGVRAGEVVSAARWKFAGSTGAARLAEVGRENPAEREPDLTVARRAGQAPGSAARAGASGSASPEGGGQPGSSLQWPGRARRG